MQLFERVSDLRDFLGNHVPSNRLAGIFLENSLDWAVCDLALAQQKLISVPIPAFFTTGQKQRLLIDYGINVVLTSETLAKELELTDWDWFDLPGNSSVRLYRSQLQNDARFHESWFGKLTFTSGSTAWPKPIALANEQLWTVADSLAHAFKHMRPQKHLCMLPLSILLENVAGLYVTLLLGGEVVFAPPVRTGLLGSSWFDAKAAIQTIRDSEAHSVILLPEMLKALVEEGEESGLGKHQLKIVAVGGGKVAPELVVRGKAIGLPVYEGYGLSEAASVVSVNTSNNQRAGSVGKPLPHADVRIAQDNEIIIRTEVLDSLTGFRSQVDIPSGDLGHLDRDGYLYVLGRKKNVLITSFGRNVSPEWPEATLTSFPGVAQAFVFGDGQPALSALLVPARADVTNRALARVLAAANKMLPDYAQIISWGRVDEPFSTANGLMTPTGKLRRDAIFAWLEKSQLTNNLLPTGDRLNDRVLSDADHVYTS